MPFHVNTLVVDMQQQLHPEWVMMMFPPRQPLNGHGVLCSMADQPALAYNWHILPSRLQICRDAKERPVRLGKGATGVVRP